MALTPLPTPLHRRSRKNILDLVTKSLRGVKFDGVRVKPLTDVHPAANEVLDHVSAVTSTATSQPPMSVAFLDVKHMADHLPLDHIILTTLKCYDAYMQQGVVTGNTHAVLISISETGEVTRSLVGVDQVELHMMAVTEYVLSELENK